MRFTSMHPRRFVLFILTLCFAASAELFSQSENATNASRLCNMTAAFAANASVAKFQNGSGTSALFGKIPAKPPGKNFRVAVLYFKLTNDEFELGSVTAGWPHDMPHPSWKNEFLINVPYDSMTFEAELARKPESLTAYYYHMSGGNLWLYGDEVTYAGAPLTETDYGNPDVDWLAFRFNNRQVLGWFASNYNLSKLDYNRDGNADVILFICRSRLKFAASGEPGFSYLKDPSDIRGITSQSGTYQTDSYSFSEARTLAAHAIGHLLGLPHLDGLYRWNLMAGVYTSQSGTLMSAQERKLLGWLEYEVIDNNTREVRLSNLVHSNRAVKIPIKGTTEYFVVEHRTHHTAYATLPSQQAKSGLLFYYVSKEMPHPNAPETPFIIPADGLVTNTLLSRDDIKYGGYFNGDGSDLFGYYDRTEITPYTNPSTSTPRNPHTGIALKNIHREGEDFVFDVYFDYVEEQPASNPGPQRFDIRAYPNPFTWQTRIFYDLPQAGNVKLTLYNAMGQEQAVLVEGWQEAWHYEVRFDGYAYPAGVYFYVLETPVGKEHGKMILLPKH